MPDLIDPKTNPRVLLTVRKNLLIASILGLAAALIITIGTIPQFKQVIALRKKVKSSAQELKKYEDKLVALKTAKNSDIFNEKENINEIMPSHKPLLEILTSLNSINQNVLVAISNLELAPGEISTDSADTTPDDDKLLLEITAIGEISQIYEFITQVEKSSPISTVTSLSLTKRETINTKDDQEQEEELIENKTEDSYLAEADMVITTNFFTKQIKASIDSPLPEVSSDQKQVLAKINSFSPNQLEMPDVITGGGLEDPFAVIGPMTKYTISPDEITD